MAQTLSYHIPKPDEKAPGVGLVAFCMMSVCVLLQALVMVLIFEHDPTVVDPDAILPAVGRAYGIAVVPSSTMAVLAYARKCTRTRMATAAFVMAYLGIFAWLGFFILLVWQ